MANLTHTKSGETVQFKSPREADIKSMKVYFSPRQEGSGTPSPENIRPITGWTGIELSGCGKVADGKNLLTLNGAVSGMYIPENGVISSTSYMCYSVLIPLDKGSYVFSGTCNVTGAVNTRIHGYDDEGNWVKQIGVQPVGNGQKWIMPFQIYGNIKYIRISTINSLTDGQIERGSTPTAYEPYRGRNYRIPDEYQEVEYLEGTGTQYIITNLIPKFLENEEFFMRFAYTSSSKTQIFFGGNSKTTRFQGVALRSSSSVFGLRQSDNCSSYSGSALFGMNEWIDFSIANNTQTCKEAIGTIKDTIHDNSIELVLFGKGGETTTLSSMKLACTYYKRDGEYELNLIPCYRKSDDEPGMYDLVSGTFYTNSGTGEFLVGPDVNTIAVDWSESVGTVYGGYVDLISGELVETWDNTEMSEFSSITKVATDSEPWYHRFDLKDYRNSGWTKASGTSNMICDVCSVGDAKSNYTMVGVSNTVDIYVYDNTIETVDEFKEKYAGHYIAYPIKPAFYRTYQLTPYQIKTLKNSNVLWSNADSVEIEYDLIETADIRKARRNVLIGSAPHLESASGKSANFTTDLKSPLTECKVYFEPIQDLHGYSKPWVGGSGKNLFDKSAEVSGKGINASGTVVDVSTASYSQLIPVTEGQTYTFSATSNYSAQWARRIHFYDQNETWVQQGAVVSEVGDSGIPVGQQYSMSVTIPTDIKYVRISYMGTTSGNSNQDTNPQFELGSTATTYEPYENICPITGWDSVTVTIPNSKNLVKSDDPTNPNANYHHTSTGWTAYSEEENAFYSDGAGVSITAHGLKSGQSSRMFIAPADMTVTLSLEYKNVGTSYGLRLHVKGTRITDIKGTADSIWHKYSYTTTLQKGDTIYLMCYANIYWRNIQIEISSTATDYEEYKEPTVFDIQFPQTIYGGYVDLVNGEVVMNIHMPTSWTATRGGAANQYGYVTYKADVSYVRSVNPVQEMCNSISSYGTISITNVNKRMIERANGNVYVALPEGEDVNDIQYAYRIATPVTYSLTPQTINTLKGINNIWSNANGNINITYWTH